MCSERGTKEIEEEIEFPDFLGEFQDVFTNDILRKLTSKRGQDDHNIGLKPDSSPPNKPPYRILQAQPKEIMRQVNELVENGMVRPISSPLCSPILLVQKHDGTSRMWLI